MGNCDFKKEKAANEEVASLSKNLFLSHYIIGKGGFGKVKIKYKKGLAS